MAYKPKPSEKLSNFSDGIYYKRKYPSPLILFKLQSTCQRNGTESRHSPAKRRFECLPRSRKNRQRAPSESRQLAKRRRSPSCRGHRFERTDRQRIRHSRRSASPAVSYQIGQHFKELAKQNSDGKLTGKQETAHILAHAVLGAATAAAGDNNALAGAISAGSAEAAAPLIGNYLYGEKDGSKLTAEQKETVTAITSLLGAATGATVGNSATNAVQGSLNVQGAVENNYGVSAISKGRRVIRIIQRGGRLTPKDALPVAEAGLVVAAACAITGNCDASQVLKDVWSGEFEDSYMASGNTDNANDKKTNAQSAAVSQSSAGAPMPPDDEDKDKSSIDHIVKDKNGEFVGNVNKGATENIRTVSQREFHQIKNNLLKNAKEVGKYSNGRGTWYQLPNGDRFGVRGSSRHGETLDFNVKGLPRDFKIHQK
ncbi:VENN motif pre-toxin domain-containing protein [Neisseria yangbaofengii]|uniref:VENN motif pre-toxin domain-containing protein n=1 Tax=Neisseria yangbaofengii TaxID=2709396 RepID=UPI003BA2A1DD